MTCHSFLRTLWRIRSTLIIILTPLLLLPIPIIYNIKAGRCAYALLIMAVYWMTEAIPMAVTALLPAILMPWLDVMSSKDICKNYLKDTNMLLFGGLIVAVAVERWNLHKRIALRVLLLFGSQPRWLMLGFMSVTAFLSMWISNTATTAMMLPITHAVIMQLKDHMTGSTEHHTNPAYDGEEAEAGDEEDVNGVHAEKPDVKTVRSADDVMVMEMTVKTSNGEVPTEPDASNKPGEPEELSKGEKKFNHLTKGMMMCVAYAANIGGTATLTGTPPNLVLKGQLDTLFGDTHGISFSSWFIYSFPNMLVSLILAWIWLMLVYIGPRDSFTCKKQSEEMAKNVKGVIRKEYNNLGKMSFAEIAVLIHFIVMALLWLTRKPDFVPGWSSLLKGYEGYVGDSTVALTVALMLYIIPSRRPSYFCFRKKSDRGLDGPAPPLLDWKTTHEHMAWGIILVLGGGFALADATKVSGLSAVIAHWFEAFGSFPVWAIVLLLCVITATFTEVTSNTATATIFLPILAELAKSLHINPLYLMIPTTISTSFAFMLPVATPPNAIAFAFGHLRIFDMVKTGIVMNIICIVVGQISINTWGYAYFHLDQFPDWACSPDCVNATSTMAP